MNIYKIDNIDLVSTLGFDVEKVSGIEQIPGRKGDTFQDWPDSNGIEPFVDSDDIILNEREFLITMFLRVTSTIEAQTKLQALEIILYATGLRTLSISYSTPTYSCFCKEGLVVERMTNIVTDMIVYKVTLKLTESS